jgi:deazaflavin-dependent oxidoreductase (nitroreductase family)
MPAATRNPLTEFLFRHHPAIYRRTGGKIGGKIGNAPVLLLNTIGRKTGQPRSNCLMCVERENGWAIAASWAGEPKHPIWYLNLMAAPDTNIEWQGKIEPVRARLLQGEERDQVWQEIVAQDEGFSVYEERTSGVREIPVVLLEKRPARILYGMNCSYFTGKLEAYFQTKGIPFEFREMNRAEFINCGKETGVMQFPCVKEPDGTWLTDTTKIIEHFEGLASGRPVTPSDPVAGFCSRMFEDLFDEWYWRPALYYRWAHADDARLMSTELARQLLRDVPAPLFLSRLFILLRQRQVYMKKDGVTKSTAPLIEAQYLASLTELNKILAKRPYLFGEVPCEADFGLFGPFFRHFFCDPTSGRLMRNQAPNLLHWVTRLWSTRPSDIADKNSISEIPDDLDYFFDMISDDYLPYLKANADAVAQGDANVGYRAQNADWEVPVAPYRARCLNDLKQGYLALDEQAQMKVAELLSASAITILKMPLTKIIDETRIVGRLGLRT